tara:strand:+ start:1200 stop:1799 length:600 start_codon:yes stop_codon:yes gene_type:complete
MSKAIIHDKNSRLDTDFGFNYLQMLTGFTFDEIVKLVGIKTRGKNKGKLKGVLYWKKCVRGGWVNQGMGGWYEDGAKGYVLTPNTKFDHNIDFRIKIDSNLINDSFFKLRREKVWYSFWYNSLKQQFVENHKEIIDYNKSKSGGTFIYKDNVDEEARVDLQEDFFELRTNTNRINQVRERIKQKAKNRIVKSIKEKENE